MSPNATVHIIEEHLNTTLLRSHISQALMYQKREENTYIRWDF